MIQPMKSDPDQDYHAFKREIHRLAEGYREKVPGESAIEVILFAIIELIRAEKKQYQRSHGEEENSHRVVACLDGAISSIRHACLAYYSSLK